jgi:hypothetical protein
MRQDVMALVVILIGSLGAGVGCQAVGGRIDDSALAALGKASERVMAERMEGSFGRPGPVLGRAYALGGSFVGPVSEVVLGLSRAIGYGFVIKNARCGDLAVVIEPPEPGRDVYWLIKDLNKQLKEHGAAIGVDTINKRLVLSASEDGR